MFMKKPSTSLVITAHVVLFTTAVFFSGLNIILEEVLNPDRNDALIFGFYRLLATSIIMPFLLCCTMEKRDRENWRKSEFWIYLFGGGVFGIFLNQIGFIIGLEWTDADISAIFQPLGAIVTAIIGIAVGLERFTIMKGLGFILSIGGVIGSLLLNGINANGNTIKGDIFLFIGVLGQAIFLFLQKPILEKFSPSFITACAMWSGTVATFFATLTRFEKFSDFEWNLKVVGALIYCSLGCSVLCYVAMSWANSYIDASLVAIYNVLQPPITDLMAYFILNETLTLYTIGGCGCVIIGLVIVVHQSYIESLENQPQPIVNEKLMSEKPQAEILI